MASIKKRTWTTKDGQTHSGWRGRYKGADGRWKSVSDETKGAVEKEIERRVGAVKLGVDPDQTATAAAGCDVWIQACEVGRDGREPVERSTLDQYKLHAKKHIKPRIGGMRLSKFTTPDAIRFRTDILKELSRPMARKVLQSVKAMFKECKVQGLIASDPFYGVVIKDSRRTRRKVVIPVRAEIAAILKAADELAVHKDKRVAVAWTRRYRVLIRTAIMTGLRGSELRGLPKGLGIDAERGIGLDLKAGKIRVVQRADAYGALGPPKSVNGYRAVDLPPVLIKELREHMLKVKGPLVFGTGGGTPDLPGNIHKRCIRPLMKQAGLKKSYGLKAFRHFYASMLIADGATMKEIQDALGHATVQVTMDNYGHLFPDDAPDRKTRIDRLGTALLGPLPID